MDEEAKAAATKKMKKILIADDECFNIRAIHVIL
jgi:PleD family two-component response regulator